RAGRTRPLAGRWRAADPASTDSALTEPGLFRTAFPAHPATSHRGGHDRPTGPEAGSDTDGKDPYEVLGEVLDQCQAAGLLDPHRRPGAEIAAWSAVHGLAGLPLAGPLPTTGAGGKFPLS